MATGTLTVRIPEDYADVISALDGTFVCDRNAIEQMLREATGPIMDDIDSLLGSKWDEHTGDELGGLARRLEVIANALKDIGEPEFTRCRLGHLRSASGLSRKAIADACGVEMQTVHWWEIDQTPIPPEHAAALAEGFGVSTEFLTGEFPAQEEDR